MRQKPLFHKVSSSVVAALPAAANHPVARYYNRDLRNTQTDTHTKKGREQRVRRRGSAAGEGAHKSTAKPGIVRHRARGDRD